MSPRDLITPRLPTAFFHKHATKGAAKDSEGAPSSEGGRQGRDPATGHGFIPHERWYAWTQAERDAHMEARSTASAAIVGAKEHATTPCPDPVPLTVPGPKSVVHQESTLGTTQRKVPLPAGTYVRSMMSNSAQTEATQPPTTNGQQVYRRLSNVSRCGRF